jgi:molybdenum cofactor cytidylyltransferase
MSKRIVRVVILAAGESSRLGSPKQLLLFRGTTLIRHLAKTALDSRAKGVSIVLGAHAEKIRNEVSRLPVSIVENPRWSNGIASSIGAAVAALAPDTSAVILALSDQPLVTMMKTRSALPHARTQTPLAFRPSSPAGTSASFPPFPATRARSL